MNKKIIKHDNKIVKYSNKILTAEENDTLNAVLNGTLVSYSNASITKIPAYLFSENINLATFNAPNVTSVGDYAFNKCSNLSNINLGPLKSIGKYAFYNCSKIKNLDLTQLSGQIPEYAFYNCQELEELNSPLLTRIDQYGIYNCKNIKKIDCPEITYLGYYSCYLLEDLEEVNLPKLSSTDSKVFQYCHKLKEAVFPSLTYAGSYFIAYCNNIEYIYLPLATSLSSYAFYRNENLKTVILDKVTSIGSQALDDCKKLERLIIRNDYSSINFYSGTYGSLDTEFSGKIYFLSHLVETYKSKTNWSTWGDNMRPIYSVNSFDIGSVNQTTNENNETILTAVPNENSRFVGWYNGDYEYTEIVVNQENVNYEDLGITYPLALNDNGYYQNTNNGAHNKFSAGRFKFNIEQENQIVRVSYIQPKTSNYYNYGIIGNIDEAINLDINYKNGTSLKSISNTTGYIIFENLSVGEHFIDIKYVETYGSGSTNPNIFQVKIEVGDLKTVQVPLGELYSTEHEINIGVIDEKTMMPLNLVAAFEEV